jgi:hypothetical protein
MRLRRLAERKNALGGRSAFENAPAAMAKRASANARGV